MPWSVLSDRCVWRPRTGLVRCPPLALLSFAALFLALLASMASAQQAVPTPWQAEAQSPRRFEPPSGSAPKAPAEVRAPDAPGPGRARVTLSAYLTQDGEPIDQGLIWRIYTEKPNVEPPQPQLVSTSKVPSPSVELAPGSYVVNVAFGRAHLTRRIAVAAGNTAAEERFILNAGGLRVTAVLGEIEKVPDLTVSYDVYQGDADRLGGRTKVVGGLRPGLIVRLNAGLYHLVSTMGDANAVVSSDVTVEAGKLTDAVIHHHAARVTLKLVTRAGGEAQADTLWAVHGADGALVRESQGALPTHILAAGDYVASAKHAGRLYQKQFTVVSGQPTQVEVVMH